MTRYIPALLLLAACDGTAVVDTDMDTGVDCLTPTDAASVRVVWLLDMSDESSIAVRDWAYQWEHVAFAPNPRFTFTMAYFREGAFLTQRDYLPGEAPIAEQNYPAGSPLPPMLTWAAGMPEGPEEHTAFVAVTEREDAEDADVLRTRSDAWSLHTWDATPSTYENPPTDYCSDNLFGDIFATNLLLEP